MYTTASFVWITCQFVVFCFVLALIFKIVKSRYTPSRCDELRSIFQKSNQLVTNYQNKVDVALSIMSWKNAYVWEWKPLDLHLMREDRNRMFKTRPRNDLFDVAAEMLENKYKYRNIYPAVWIVLRKLVANEDIVLDDYYTDSGENLLHLVSGYGTRDMVEFILNSGININAGTLNFDRNMTALHMALRFNRTDNAEFLVNRGIDINISRKNDGFKPIHQVARSLIRTQQKRMFEILLSNGANINSKDSYGSTPLHYARIQENPELVQWLIDNGADVCIENKYNETPYNHRCSCNYTPKVDAVLRNNCPVYKTLIDMGIPKCDSIGWLY